MKAIRFTIKRSEIKVRKTLPTHLVAQRVMKKKTAYNRKRAKRLEDFS